MVGRDAAGRRVFDEDVTEPGDDVRDTPVIAEILRGSDLDVLLHGMTGGEFLYDEWAVELPFDGGNEDFTRLPELLQEPTDKAADTALVLPDVPGRPVPVSDADIAQVLPGIMTDEFLLSKDVDLPLVLPGDGSEVAALDMSGDAEALVGFPTHMLTLDPDGGFMGGTDDVGRLHDHDGWLF